MKKVVTLLLLFVFLLSGCGKNSFPTNPTSVLADSNAEINLSWQDSENNEFYRIYRLEDGETDYRFLADTTDTYFTDTTVKEDVLYQYKITSVLGNKESDGVITGKVSLYSQITTEENGLSVPVISSVTKMDKYTNVVIFTDDNDDCEYEIFRSNTQNGKYVSIGVTSEKAFYDDEASGKSYYYKIATKSNNGNSAESNGAYTGKNRGKVFSVPIIMYHEFVTEEDLKNGIAFDKYAIMKDEFESDLKWLKENGYTTITTSQLADYMEGKITEIPQKPILLSCDDGKLGVYKNAYPLLKKYGMTMSLALIGYRIDLATQNPKERQASEAPYCTWEEIDEMAKSKAVEMISHTQSLHIYSHDKRSGANCADGETLQSFLPIAQADYAKFIGNLKKNIGFSTVAMAYPYSKRSEIADIAHMKAGYKILLSGDDDSSRKTYSNYYVVGAGINSKSALARRLVRMAGIPLENYVTEAIRHDN